jgi:hypothetical protein
MNEIDLTQIERNIFRDYLQDGLLDILFGGFLLIIGLGLAAGHVGPFIVFVIFLPLLFRALKRRFVYPRTGYVELREGDPGPVPWFVLGSFLLGLIALILVLIAVGVIGDPGQWYRWMPILFGTCLAGIFLGLAVQIGLVRHYIVAFLALATVPVFVLLPLPGKLENLGLYLASVNAVVLIWGLIVFIRFLRQHPLLAEGADDARE